MAVTPSTRGRGGIVVTAAMLGDCHSLKYLKGSETLTMVDYCALVSMAAPRNGSEGMMLGKSEAHSQRIDASGT